MNWPPRHYLAFTVVCCVTIMASAGKNALAANPEMLRLDVFIGQADSWDVTSTLICGKSEAILVDSQFRISQAKRLADQVTARGRRLKAIIVTHPDYDHYIGKAMLHERFPDTPIYMTAVALEEFNAPQGEELAKKKASAV